MKKISTTQPNEEQSLLQEIVNLIEQSQSQVAVQVNSAVTMLFWQVGNRINQEILQNKRADYGKRIVSTVSAQLEEKYERNFEEKNLRRMLQFAEQFTDFQIVVTLSRQLSWSHFLVLIPLKNIEAELFYAQKSGEANWGVRDLRKHIAEKEFERTSLVNLQLTSSSNIPLNTFKDPYLLDFLGLKDTYLEADLKSAILKELENFMLELGKGFACVERQKRMIIDGEDFILSTFLN